MLFWIQVTYFCLNDSCLRAHIPWISICGSSWGLGLKSCLHRGFAFVAADHLWVLNTVWIHTRFYLVCFKPNKLCEFWHQICLRMQLWLNPQRETSVFSIPHRVKREACRPELSEAWFFQLTHWGYHFGGVSAPGLVPWSTFPLDCASWARAGALKHCAGSTTYRVPLSKCQLLCLLTLLHLCFWSFVDLKPLS